jgi:non-canonical purine NTP pyrophosphatase (RdgB/HAM1 family)
MENINQIILASQNKGKLKEFLSIATEYGHDNIFITKSINQDCGIIEETGNSYLENALIKANTVYSFYKEPVISDDSGLELIDFNNIPGVFSARFAGLNASDEDNRKKLISFLQSHDLVETPALYRCVLVFKPDSERHFIFEGTCSGCVSITSRGNSGFGYDPMFIPDSFSCTVSQLDISIKNKISHRAMALKKFFVFLQTIK